MTQQQTRPQPVLPDPFQRPPKRHTLVWITLAAVVLLVIGALVYSLPSLTRPPAVHTVVYTVEADAAYGSGRTGTVTAESSDGGTTQRTGLLPITGTFTQFHTGDFVYVSVQNGQGQGSVTCRITVDGVVVSENTSSGGYTIATCQGTVPR